MNMELLKAGVIYEISKQLDEIEFDEQKIIDSEVNYLLREIYSIINTDIYDNEKVRLIKELFKSRDLHSAPERKIKIINR